MMRYATVRSSQRPLAVGAVAAVKHAAARLDAGDDALRFAAWLPADPVAADDMFKAATRDTAGQLAGGVLDPEVIADGHQLLPHLVALAATAAAGGAMPANGRLQLDQYFMKPSSSSSKSAGASLDACAGARLTEQVFDINDDGVIDNQDMVNIGTPTDPVWVPPTSIEFDGRLQPPAIIILDEKREMLYMSSSRGEIQLQLKKAVKLGMTFWRVYRP